MHLLVWKWHYFHFFTQFRPLWSYICCLLFWLCICMEGFANFNCLLSLTLFNIVMPECQWPCLCEYSPKKWEQRPQSYRCKKFEKVVENYLKMIGCYKQLLGRQSFKYCIPYVMGSFTTIYIFVEVSQPRNFGEWRNGAAFFANLWKGDEATTAGFSIRGSWSWALLYIKLWLSNLLSHSFMRS